MPGVIPAVRSVAEEGTVVATRPTLNFIGAAVTASDNSAQNRTDVTIGSSPFFDVKATYGATGDGVADDTAEIQAAVDAAQARAGGGIVFFPAGIYKISSAITITQHVSLVGEGANFSWQSNLAATGSVIMNTGASSDAFKITCTDSRPTNKMTSGWRFRGLAIDSAAATSAYAAYNSASPGTICGGTAINCYSNACNVVIEDCFIARHACGINLCSDTVNYTADNEVRSTFVYMCRDYGIRMQYGVGNKIHGCNVRANWSAEWATHAGGTNDHNGGYRGISMEGGDGHMISNTEVISYQYGYYLAASNVKCVNCWGDSCPNPFYSTGRSNMFVGCFATACHDADNPLAAIPFPVGNAAFKVTGDATVLSGCHVSRGTVGIELEGDWPVLTGNMISLYTDSGTALKFTGTTTYAAISGNVFYGGTGVDFNGIGTLTGAMTGNSGSAFTGSRGSLILRGNQGAADAG